MKSIGICGSPRASGNTKILVRRRLGKIEESGIETEFVGLRTVERFGENLACLAEKLGQQTGCRQI